MSIDSFFKLQSGVTIFAVLETIFFFGLVAVVVLQLLVAGAVISAHGTGAEESEQTYRFEGNNK